MSYSDVKIKSNSKFIKIETGEPHDVRLLDDSPTEIFKHSTEQGVSVCGGEKCFTCDDGEEPVQKFVTNVFDHTLGKVMLWEYGSGVAKQLKSIAETLEEEGHTITKVDLNIKATGSGQQKRYLVTPRITSKPIPDGLMKHAVVAA